MVVAKIQAQLAAYKQWLLQVKHHPRLYKWESVQHFQSVWNLDAADLAAMFAQSFYNSENRRLWQTENWEPKRLMQLFWQFNPATVKLMFEDLYNETRDVEARVGRFRFGCDMLLSDYKREHPTSIENNHYHDDCRMIALYLAFRYPENYAPYEFRVFQNATIKLGAREIPQENDLARYFKILKTLGTFVDKDPQIALAMRKHLHPTRHYGEKTALLTEDFCCFMMD